MAKSKHATDKPPAFQFYAKEFLSATMALSCAHVGAYTRLLAWSWDNGPLPEDERGRAQITGLSLREFRLAWSAIGTKWVLSPAGYVNDRLEAQRQALADYAAQQSARGAAGAAAKWQKHRSTDGGSNGASNGASNGGSITQVMPDGWPDDGSAVYDLRSADHSHARDQRESADQEQRAGARPSLADETTVREVRPHLLAAAHAYLTDHPDAGDGDVAEVVKQAAARLHARDYGGANITAVVNAVRAQRARRVG